MVVVFGQASTRVRGDNKTLCDLINLEVHVSNPSYDAIVQRMRERSYVLFRDTFRHKAGYLNTHDWRVRECNKAADLVCNACLGLEQDVSDIDTGSIADALHAGAQMQLYSDGGFKAGRGASAFVVVLSRYSGSQWVAELAGYKGVFMTDAGSAFQAEVVAADMAIEFARELAF